MPTRVPRSASFWIVPIDDDALHDLPTDVMRAYESTRDFEILKPHLEGLDPQPTMYFCRPLRPEYQRKVPALMIPSADVDDLWDLFSVHCEKVKGLLDDNGREVVVKREGKGDKERIPDHYRGDDDHPPTIPMKDFREVAQVVIHKGTKGDNVPFSLQGTWAQSRVNRVRERSAREGAVALLEKIAAKSRIDSSSDSESNEKSTEGTGAS